MDDDRRLQGAWGTFAAEHAPDALLVVDGKGGLTWGSPSASILLGHDTQEAVGTNVFELVHPDDLGYAAGALHETVRKDGLHLPVQIRVAHADGHWVDVEITASTTAGPDGSARIVLSLRPLDPRLVLPQRRRAFEDLLDGVARRCAGATWQGVAGILGDALAQIGEFLGATRVIFATRDHDTHTLRIQAEWSTPDIRPASLASVDPEFLIFDPQNDGGPIPQFRYAEDVTLIAGRSRAFLEHLDVRSELVIPVAPDNVLLAILAVHWATSADQLWDDALGAHANTLAQILTTTLQRSQSEAVVHHQSLHDPLTGLANRTLLVASIEQALSNLVPDTRSGLAILYCDLDGFKHINDRHSHDAGDRTLIDVATRIRSQVRPGDIVGRIGGDEFVVLCHRTKNRDMAEDVARRIRTAVASRPPEGLTDRLDISIGIAWTSQPGNAEDLVREADRQMYLVKQGHHAQQPNPKAMSGQAFR